MLEIKNEKIQVIWSNLVLKFKDQIVSSYSTYKGNQRIFKSSRVSKLKDIAVKNSLVPIMFKIDNGDVIEGVNTKFPALNSSACTSSSPNKSKLGHLISIYDRYQVIKVYEGFDETRMLILSSVRYVEQVMNQMLVELDYEQ